MKNQASHKGFTLIAAIFLLVVVAALVVYMVNLRVVQQTTLVYGVQGARAIQAARSGIEWGTSRSLATGVCPAATTLNFPAGVTALRDFSVDLTCNQSTHTEAAAPPITVFQLTATARTGVYGTLDFVQRIIRATVSQSPP